MSKLSRGIINFESGPRQPTKQEASSSYLAPISQKRRRPRPKSAISASATTSTKRTRTNQTKNRTSRQTTRLIGSICCDPKRLLFVIDQTGLNSLPHEPKPIHFKNDSFRLVQLWPYVYSFDARGIALHIPGLLLSNRLIFFVRFFEGRAIDSFISRSRYICPAFYSEYCSFFNTR
jgi:hypothetical protein